MIARTCLLISDDPDDHIEFSEALYEISDDTVLITIADLKKAVELLSLRICIPEYIILNIAISGFEDPDILFTSVEDADLQHIQIIAYGESRYFSALRKHRISAFLDADISYSELKVFLDKVLRGEAQ